MAQFLGEREIPARLARAAERGAHGEEVGGRGDVVHAEDVRAGSTPCASAASVPASRSRGARPVSAPMKSLREIAISSGRPSSCRRSSSQSSAIVCAGVLAKSGPGSTISCSRATPAASATLDALAQERQHLGDDVVVEVGVLQRVRAARRACASARARRPSRRRRSASSRVAQAADVVDDARAGRDRGARDGRLVGVDRDERAELAGDALDQRHDALESPPRPAPAGARSWPTRRRRRGCRRRRRAARSASAHLGVERRVQRRRR